MIAIIGVLVALLLPAIQAARESARRESCANNLRQLGIAAQNFYSARKVFPQGATAKGWSAQPTTAWTFYRWSALAHLTPFLEQTNAHNALDLTVPLYGNGFAVTTQNLNGAKIVVPDFLCPSDHGQVLTDGFAPTNYAACTGSGGGGGTPIATDGVAFVNSAVKLAQITDGSSKTALFSESNLGPQQQMSFRDPQVDYKFVLVAPLTDTLCKVATQYNYTDRRGFSWVDGEYRCGLYNHYYPPNHSLHDCIGVYGSGGLPMQYTPFGWRTARSRHPGGVNMAFADSSVHFIANEIDPTLWTGLSTRAGGEIVDPSFLGP